MLSESSPGRRFLYRYRLRLFWCAGCGVRLKKGEGVLTSTDKGKLQWACVGCYVSHGGDPSDGTLAS